MFRRSLIENLEYLADSGVLSKGTDLNLYQLSILNQYIGRASISNQFSRQIKNRINMLNKNYKLGSRWKLALLLPLTVIALFIVSCTDKDTPVEPIEAIETTSPDTYTGELFYIVEEMPTFNGSEDPLEFRKYIARNLKYPSEASEQGVGGTIQIKFIVSHEGKVEVPDQEKLARVEGKSIDEVKRVVLSSPEWQPGKQRGKTVDVIFTFPVTFALQ